jgi:hypothetical protein
VTRRTPAPGRAGVAPDYLSFHGQPKRPGLALGLWKRIADHPERLALSASRASGAAVEGTRLDVVDDDSEGVAVRVVSGNTLDVPAYSTLLVSLVP